MSTRNSQLEVTGPLATKGESASGMDSPGVTGPLAIPSITMPPHWSTLKLLGWAGAPKEADPDPGSTAPAAAATEDAAEAATAKPERIRCPTASAVPPGREGNAVVSHGVQAAAAGAGRGGALAFPGGAFCAAGALRPHGMATSVRNDTGTRRTEAAHDEEEGAEGRSRGLR